MLFKNTFSLFFVLFILAPFTWAADPTIEYEVNLQNGNISRGADAYEEVFPYKGKDYSFFNATPALLPSFTYNTVVALSIAGHFPLANRAAGTYPDGVTPFAGFETLDHMELAVAKSWDTGAGSIELSHVSTVLINGGDGAGEAALSWGLPFAEDSLAPTLGYAVVTNTGGGYYASGTMSGGETFPWEVNLGHISGGVSDVTGSFGVTFGSFAVKGSLTHRPNLELHDTDGTADGQYTSPVDGSTKDLPPNLVWLTFTYSGEK